MLVLSSLIPLNVFCFSFVITTCQQLLIKLMFQNGGLCFFQETCFYFLLLASLIGKTNLNLALKFSFSKFPKYHCRILILYVEAYYASSARRYSRDHSTCLNYIYKNKCLSVNCNTHQPINFLHTAICCFWGWFSWASIVQRERELGYIFHTNTVGAGQHINSSPLQKMKTLF